MTATYAEAFSAIDTAGAPAWLGELRRAAISHAINRQKIKESWTQNHAPNWRKWRVKQILFIIDQRASEVAAELAR